MKRRTFLFILLFLTAQIAWGNYAFYNTVKKTCEGYRVTIERSDMALENGSFAMTLSSGRNNFEMMMVVGFAAAGQAIRQQYYLAEKHADYNPVVPEKISIKVIVPVERNQMTIFAYASSDLVFQLAEGKIETVDFMRLIKDSIQTL